MAEKLELITSLKIDFSQFKNDVEGAKKYLGGLQAEYAKVVQVFGEGSKEAKEAGEAIRQMTEYLKKTGAAGTGIDQPIKSIKSQLKEANAELSIAIQKFGLGSKEAAAAAAKVAELKDTIGDAKTLTDAFNPDAKFKGLANAVQGAVGAITALQGAQALFGEESKDLQKTLVKVQGALALSQGVNSVLEAKDAFKALGSQAADALKGIRTGIAATGIGLLVVALGTIVAYWDDIKEAVSGVSDEQEKLNEQTTKDLAANEEKLSALEGQEQQLKAQGKSEKDILNLKIKQTDEAIKTAEINLENAKATKNAQVEASKRNKDILQGIITFITAPLTALLKGVDLIGNALGKNLNLAEKFTGGLAKLVFDPEEVAKEGDDAIAEAEKKLNGLKEKRAGYQNSVTAIDKAEAEKRSQQAKEAADKERQLEEQRQKDAEARAQANAARQAAIDKQIQDNRLAQIKDGRYKEQLLVDTQYDQNIQALIDNDAAQIKALKESLDKNLISREEYNKQIQNVEALSNQQRLAADEAYRIQKAAVDKKYDDQEKLKALNDATAKLEKTSEDEAIFFTKRKEALDQEQALLDEAYKNKLISDEEYTKQTKENADTRVRIGKAEIEARKALATNTANLLNTLSELVGKNTKAGKAAAIAGLVIQQAQTVAQVTTDTIKSTKAISAKYAGVPGGQIPAAIEIGLNVAQGALAIKKAVGAVKKGIADIKGASASSSPSASGDVQGGGAPIEASAPIPAQQPTTALPQDQINQISSANATVRAYVVESDVSGNQERITRLNRAARIS